MDERQAAIELMSKSLAAIELIFGVKTIEDYARNLRAAVRGLWNGTYSREDFIFQVGQALERAFNQAWIEGARMMGIEPDEQTPEEQRELDRLIFEQSGYIPGLADYVMENLKVDGHKLADAQSRIPMWVNRYREVMNTAKTTAGEDQKLMWVLGPTEHCSSCLKLAGKVKRASMWRASGIHPQHPDLECHGINCLCELQPTSEPMSRGPLPSLP